MQWQQSVQSEPEKAVPRSLAASESLARELGRRLAQVALATVLAESGKGYVGTQLPCACGGRLRYQRDAPRTVRTVVGEVEYVRAYYYCRDCGASRCPKDEELGQGERAISPGVERMVALLGAHLSFATSAQVLTEVGGLALSDRQVETVAEAVGARAETQMQQEAAAAQTQDLAPAPPAPGGAAPGRVWVVEMDGVTAPLQDGTWQEVKCGVIYELGQRVEISAGRWELLRRERCVVRGPVGEFRRRLWATLQRAGARVGEAIVVLGDGAEWIDQTVAELFVGATRILDFYHAAQRVWTVAGLRYGEGSAAAVMWAHTKLRQLKAGAVREVCQALKLVKLEEAQAQQTRAESVRYLETRQTQMAYDEYQAASLPLGSGAIEGTCKYLVTARCKQAGMRWTQAGLDAILALRCWVLNERLDDLCPRPKVKLDWGWAP
jgi:Uncharacterised protein family (UPF0236)